jgi:hypothetical protein
VFTDLLPNNGSIRHSMNFHGRLNLESHAENMLSFLICTISRTHFIYTYRPTAFNAKGVGWVQIYILREIMRVIHRDMRHVQSTSKCKQVHHSESPYSLSCDAEIIAGFSISVTNNSNQDHSSKLIVAQLIKKFPAHIESEISLPCPKKFTSVSQLQAF